jgi:hypothetical protein
MRLRTLPALRAGLAATAAAAAMLTPSAWALTGGTSSAPASPPAVTTSAGDPQASPAGPESSSPAASPVGTPAPASPARFAAGVLLLAAVAGHVASWGRILRPAGS